jgi:intracellular septation protein A
VVLGGVSVLTQDPRFIMVKPTLVYVILGTVMLQRGWMNRFMPPRVVGLAPDVIETFGFVWAGLMFATAAANLAVVGAGGRETWAWFIAVVPIGSKAALFTLQYLVTRATIRRRMGDTSPAS